MRTPVRALLRSPLGVVVLIAALWFVVTFLVFPNANLLVTTFFPDGAFSGRALEKLLSSDRAMRSVGNSLLSRSPSRSRSTWWASSSFW
ncbi:hypothetical protein ACR8AL_04210 [Clavibacter sepedonicus]|uniref:hypothetical protein n=1 Tax=Clavibacter TaxID=1573 RepID=UPI0002F9B00F|nr:MULTISPECIES: hypothetical protein [Clavibacter]UUK64526.1 hypothetical protein LRE50_09460 [Clavibacter sepedonicus]